MIELIIKEYLDEHLNVPSFFEFRKLDGKFIVIEKTGSSKEETLKRSTVAFQSYADSLFEASKLNEELKDTIEQAIELDSIVSIELNSDYNFTDLTFKKYRYQAVFDIHHY